MGEILLYKILRNPVNKIDILKEREKIIDIFYNNNELREKLLIRLKNIGKLNHISIWEYKDNIHQIVYSKKLHILLPILFVLTFFIIPINKLIGIPVLLLILVISIYTYYRDKVKIENYIPFLAQLGTMINLFNLFKEKTNYAVLDNYIDKLNSAAKLSSKYNKYLFMIRSTLNGSITEFDTVIDYIRVITHMDLIAFKNLIDYINKNITLVIESYEIIGYIDSLISITQLKQQNKLRNNNSLFLITPDLLVNEKGFINATDLYNPLLQNPTTNSFNIQNPILITGSNATGKSTFLRTIGINAILAQTLYIVFAREYHSSLFIVYSSMNIRDNIFNSESYYMAEIKSLKRILDSVNSKMSILCCIDEVLKGTNTIERIGAASEILKSLSQSNALCIAATHYIELSYILEKYYENYHFQEIVTEDDIMFDYCLYKGRSYTRNAIQLLRLLGYSNEIVSNAVSNVDNYIKTGTWNIGE
jgi:DNA mismatch repair ATPase MutS